MNAMQYYQTLARREQMLERGNYISFLDKIERTGMTGGIEVDAVIDVCVSGYAYFNDADSAWFVDDFSVTNEEGEEVADDEECRKFSAKLLKIYFERVGI